MNMNYQRWHRLFLFALGLFIASAFCMKWMESDFRMPLPNGGSLFTIIGLEVTYTNREVSNILTAIDDHVRSILRYHCCFDFAFMLGVYPGIAALCMMAKHKAKSQSFKMILSVLALSQLLAWIFDIIENYFLLKWINNPSEIGEDFMQFHFFVYVKWVIALMGALVAIPFATRKRRSL